MRILLKLYNKKRNFILYALIGVVGIVIDLGVFFLLYNFYGVTPTLATICSGILAILNNFTLNYYFNFKSKDHFLLRMLSFVGIAIAGLALMTIAVKVFGEILGINPNIVKLVSLILVVLIQYTINKRFTFKTKVK